MDFSLQDEWKEWFNKYHIHELYPSSTMSYPHKMNAIIRCIIVLTLVGFLVTRNYLMFLLAGVAIAVLVQLKYYRLASVATSQESFAGMDWADKNDAVVGEGHKIVVDPKSMKEVARTEFHPTTRKNPFGNVLLTDIGDQPDRRAAAPAFNPEIHSEIMQSVKKQSQMLHSSIPNLSRQIYGDVKDNFDLENSMRVFHSMPNTRVADDQGAYAQFLYGNMYSGKESTPEGAIMRVKDNYRYILM